MNPTDSANVARHRHRIRAVIVQLVTLLSQYFVMSTKKKGKGKEREEDEEKKKGVDRAVWNDEETEALLNFLIAHQSEAGDANNFKMTTFKKAADSETLIQHRRSGLEKTAKRCKTKYTGVSILRSPQDYSILNQ
jgi:hypothetical protein